MKDTIKVRIKPWDDMEEEFGLDEAGNIDTEVVFTIEMEEDMPEHRVLYVVPDERSELYDWGIPAWSISNEMIAERLNKDPYESPDQSSDTIETQRSDQHYWAKGAGMRVRIRNWDDMEKEFGLSEEGNIKTKQAFVFSMEEDLPRDRVIDVVPNTAMGGYDWHNYFWAITDDMILEYIGPTPNESSKQVSDETDATVEARSFVSATALEASAKAPSVKETIKKMPRAELENVFMALYQDFGDQVEEKNDLKLEIERLRKDLE